LFVNVSNANKREKEYYRVWLHPIVYMLRRTAFILVTVLLFEFPTMQMIVHQLLTMATLVYLCQDNLFENRLRKWVEVISELLLLLSSIVLQQFLSDFSDKSKDVGEKLFIALLLILLLTNFSLIIATICINRRETARKKYLLSLREKALADLKERARLREE